MEKYDALKLEKQLCFPLYAVSKEIVKKYNEAFDKMPEIIVQKEIPESDTTRHLYVIRLNMELLTVHYNDGHVGA